MNAKELDIARKAFVNGASWARWNPKEYDAQRAAIKEYPDPPELATVSWQVNDSGYTARVAVDLAGAPQVGFFSIQRNGQYMTKRNLSETLQLIDVEDSFELATKLINLSHNPYKSRS